MADSYRRRLLGTTLPVVMPSPYAVCNTITAQQAPPPSVDEMMAACRKLLADKPRWAGGRMMFEVAPEIPPGWFGLREPGAMLPYVSPLPLSSFGIFYRGGDVVRLSDRDRAELMRRIEPPPSPRGAGTRE